MSTLAEIERAADALPLEEVAQLLNHLTERLKNAPRSQGQRVAGIHRGRWEVAADFDAPLPDEFWLGNEA